MAIIKPNNNTISAITALPAAIPTGKVLQVVTAIDLTERSTTSTSYVTGSNTLSVSITPSATSSKIFVVVNSTGYNDNALQVTYYTIYRGTSNIGVANGMAIFRANSINDEDGVAMSILDSPSSTSSLTYQVYMKVSGGTGRLGKGTVFSTITAFEIAG